MQQQKPADARVERMFAADRRWAIGAVVVLWCLYAFTYWVLLVSKAEAGVLIALAVGGGLVLLFNTASIAAMIIHYTRDKEHIYKLDIYYLDEMKRAKG
ncbi:hypothetical protein W911_02590 [Hyphomicrobium nitrativorans NL23]|uniref:Uncharacterized protein n=1 Tax=Hyphomicrobium nitrativorans NL23 TaxID=1029756 RepID=V5SC53_9HYPH|nr:hypothetical protein [Hyphomicrobium nitrativorans]AHB47549.1 hypothetical protein W911_02590 [Hyphomicrobium nitrativorans NL23]